MTKIEQQVHFSTFSAYHDNSVAPAKIVEIQFFLKSLLPEKAVNCTLMEELKPMSVKKYDSEYCDVIKIIKILAFSNYQDSETEMTILDLSIE